MAMQDWFHKHHFEEMDKLHFAAHKPPALVYIDEQGLKAASRAGRDRELRALE
jgi:hypothetical protein